VTHVTVNDELQCSLTKTIDLGCRWKKQED